MTLQEVLVLVLSITLAIVAGLIGYEIGKQQERARLRKELKSWLPPRL